MAITRPGPSNYMDEPGFKIVDLFDQVCDLAEATDVSSTAHIVASAPHAGHSTPSSVAEAISTLAPAETFLTVGALLASAPTKSSTVTSDRLALSDSEASNSLAGVRLDDLRAPPWQSIRQPLRAENTGTCWLRKSLVTGTTEAGAWWVHVPLGSGYYAVFALGTWNVSLTIPMLGRIALGKIGSYTPHTAATKTGAFTTQVTSSHPGGTGCYSTTAGDTIAFIVTGREIVMRSGRTTNGGFSVVSLDGSYSFTTTLPKFTSTDLSNGLCRAGDVGRPYVSGYADNTCDDTHDVIAVGLTNTSHTVVFETTGTKYSAASAARSYIGGVVGCADADIGQNLIVDTRVIAFIEPVLNFHHRGSSAVVPVAEVLKADLVTYEFLSDVHGGETLLGSLEITADGVDKTGLAAGAYASGQVIQIDRSTTLASTDAPGTPVIRRDVRHLFSARQPAPCQISWAITMLADKRLRTIYAGMLPFAVLNAQRNGYGPCRFDTVRIGDYLSVSSELTTDNNAQYGNKRTLSAEISIAGTSRTAYLAMLDGGLGMDYFSTSSPYNVFFQDRSDFNKIYFARSSYGRLFRTGEVMSGVVGYGVVP